MCPARLRRAFSYVELLMATVILGSGLVATMSVMGAVAKSQKITMDRRLATQLAYSYLEETLSYAYEGSGTGSYLVKYQDGSGSMGSKQLSYSSVDDFDGSDCQPPCETDGSELPDLDNVHRTVSVELVDPDYPDTVSASDQGVKRVSVVVEVDGKELARAVGLKTRYE